MLLSRGATFNRCKTRHTMTFSGYNASTGAVARGANSQLQPHTQPVPPCSGSKKTIYLIRHGEGFHNIGFDHNLDAHLTPRGWAQTAALQQHLRAMQEQLGIQLVVVSPLRRTLETAAGVFGARAPPATAAAATAASTAATTTAAAANNPASTSSSSSHPAWVFMKQQAGRPYEVTPQHMLFLPPVQRRAVVAAAGAAAAGAALGSLSISGGGSGVAGQQVPVGEGQVEHTPLKIIAHEGCRERIGPNVCDKFRDIPLQMADFPGVNFSLMTHSTDECWEELHAAPCHDAGCYWSGEEESACERRALEFYAWIMERPESVIAVVSHCGFLVHGMRALGKAMFTTWSDAMLLEYKAAATTSTSGSSSNAPTATAPSSLPPYGTPSLPPSTYPNSPSAAPAAAASTTFPPGAASGSSTGLYTRPQQPALNPYTLTPHFSPQGSSFGPSQGPVSPLGPVSPAAQAAQVLRGHAADLTGWFSTDWNNCECRSIELRWASAAEVLSAPAAELMAAAAGGVNGKGGGGGDRGVKFLWAAPGNPLTRFPGGLYGI